MGIEILAPAGGPESIFAAVRCGADAVYVGGARFSARSGAANFTNEELAAAAEYCHLHNVKIYQAVNTLFFDDELSAVAETVKFAADIGVDALIVQDAGAAYMMKQICPDMKLNASTQMTIHTPEGARLAAENGYSRVVLSRELPLGTIAEITSCGIETEVFVHGALCMSVSGQCYMSAMIGSRSANRGACAQACRLPFSAVCGAERHDLSLKDASLVEHIKELEGAGVKSLKIEGRMKRAEYVAAAVSACRAAADGKEPDMDALEAVFSRSGFTDGYLTGKIGATMFGIRRKEDVTSAASVLPQLKELYRRESKAGEADFHAEIKRGQPSALTMTCDDVEVTAYGAPPQDALNRPTDAASLEKQLDKLGDTVYSRGKVTAEIDDGVILTAAQINQLRREAVSALDKERTELNTLKKSCHTEKVPLSFERTPAPQKREIRAYVQHFSQLDGAKGADKIILPLSETEKHTEAISGYGDKLSAALPRFVTDEAALEAKLAALKKIGLRGILCTNYGHIRIGKRLGLVMHGDYGMNVTNSLSLKKYGEMGLTDAVASIEMKCPQISAMQRFIPTGIIAYGRQPLMLTRNCPINQAVGCGKCTHQLEDRTGRHFPVRCGGTSVEILNCDILVMTDRLNEVQTDFIRLDFDRETTEEVENVIKACQKGIMPDLIGQQAQHTRGLYYRGIL